jgi:hypothetical protein
MKTTMIEHCWSSFRVGMIFSENRFPLFGIMP